MKINLYSPIRETITFGQLIGRLSIHIVSQMIITAIGGLATLKIEDWRATTIFILMVLGNGISVVTAFLDKSSSIPVSQNSITEKIV
jgi:hypothetical protein